MDTFEVSEKQPVPKKKPHKPTCYYLSKLHAKVNSGWWGIDQIKENALFSHPSDPSWLALASCLSHCHVFYSIYWDNHSWGEQEICPHVCLVFLFPTFLTVKYSVRLSCSWSGVGHKSPFTVECEVTSSTKDHEKKFHLLSHTHTHTHTHTRRQQKNRWSYYWLFTNK